MTSPFSGLQMPESQDIRYATMQCVSSFEACLTVRSLMKERWAENRLADLNLWASGVGALARPEASLDRRLQFQPKAQLVLTNLLLTLQEFVNGCRTHALNEAHTEIEDYGKEENPEYTPVSPAESALELSVDDDFDLAPSSASWFAALVSGPRTSSDTSSNSNEEEGPDEKQSEATLKEAMKDVDDLIDQLITLGLAIRKSGTAARLHRADVSFKSYENEDLRKHLEFILLNDTTRRRKNGKDNGGITTEKRMQEVASEYGLTPEQRHLITANLRRRHRFRYARRHHQKLDQTTLRPLVSNSKSRLHAGENPQQTIPRNDRSQVSDDRKLPLIGESRSTILPTVPPAIAQALEMSATAPSAVEGDILQMARPIPAAPSHVSVSVATIHYPSPPPASQPMRGFKCPCCYQILPEMYKEWSRWRKHLVEDLCPYTCPFLECSRPEVLYISRAAWRDHVLQIHGAGENWQCLICVGTGEQNMFLSAEEFVSHNRTRHKDAISEDQIVDLQDTCRRIAPPNISQCPLCPWPQDEEAIPDAAANLEHVGNCIHEFSLNALPWAESLVADAAELLSPELHRNIEEWLEGTERIESTDIQVIDIQMFGVLPTPPQLSKQEVKYVPEDYFAESSQAEQGSLSLDSALSKARGTYSDDSAQKAIFDDYTVGWICTTDDEYIAAGTFLDEEHKSLEWTHQNDVNVYTLGKIGNHNIVIAMSRRKISAGAATIAAETMIHSFPNVRVCLMVGSGSGVPSKGHSIHLGDVVVGIPTFSEKSGNQRSVMQYDYARTIQEGHFQNTNYLVTPPTALLTAINRLRTKFGAKGNWIDKTVRDKLQANQWLKGSFSRPDPFLDRPSAGDFTQTTGGIKRLEGSEGEGRSEIHYGLIASADGLMEDDEIRDILADQLDVLCFETDAAGLMSSFPCLLIRGICDYADGHFPKEWQRYAAMVAAAYAKELLETLPASDVDNTRTIQDSLSLDHAESSKNILSPFWDNQKEEAVSLSADPEGTQAKDSSRDQNHHIAPNQTAESPLAKNDITRKQTNINHVYIALIGDASAGKSSFISVCSGKDGRVGHGFQSRTTDIEDIEFMLNDHVCIHLIETPGFNDTTSADVMLKGIAYWLGKSPNQATKLNGIIYLHRITDAPIASFGQRSQLMFRKLCHENAYSSFVLATTMWDLIDDATGAHRELELAERVGFWSYMHKKGSRVFRLAQTRESCLGVIRHIISSNSTIAPELQNEIVPQDRRMENTERGVQVNEDINREHKKSEDNHGIGRAEEESHTVKCICNDSHDDGDIIYCETCETWQHINCLYPERQEEALQANFSHLCADCRKNTLEQQDKEPADLKGVPRGNVSLHDAAGDGNAATVKLLLDQGANIEVADNNGDTPLHAAAVNGRADVVQLLLDQGANSKAANSIGDTPLHAAASNGKADVVQLLLSRGADIEAADIFKNTPLHAASVNGKADVVQLLLDQGADSKAADGIGDTPLHAAAVNGKADVAQLLLNRGADIEATDNFKNTPLHKAAWDGKADVVQLLLDRGANIQAVDNDGDTPLHAAALQGITDVAQLLLDRGANINAKNNDGRTPLETALLVGNENVAKLLRDRRDGV